VEQSEEGDRFNSYMRTSSEEKETTKREEE
jgi:hypothetical protein